MAVVDSNRAGVISIPDEHAASPAFVHPQAVSFAQLTADGESLVTASGREVRVFDWRKGRLRFPTITLENSPLRVETDSQSRVLLVSTGEYRGNVFQERLSTYDLHTGDPLATGAGIPGPLAGLRLSADGRYVICWRFGEVTIRDTSTLQAVGKSLLIGADVAAALRHVYTPSGWHPDAASDADKAGTPVIDAALDRDGRRLTVLTGTSEFADAQLADFDVQSGRRIALRNLGKGQPLGLLPHGDAYEFTQWKLAAPHWLSSTGSDRVLPQISTDLDNVQAISRDGRLLASVSHGGNIVLADHASGEWAAAPLVASLPLNDSITQLSFAPDASSLLARSYYGRWLWWQLPSETRSPEKLQELLDRIHSSTSNDGNPSGTITDAMRTGLRRNDLDFPRNGDPSIQVEVPSDTTAPTTPMPGYAFVDLSPATNHPAGMADGVNENDPTVFAAIAPGVQRYLGIDFDIKGLIALSMKAMSSNPVTSARIPLATPRFNTACVLVGASTRLQNMGDFPREPFAYLDLDYADGGHARIPIVYGRDMMAAWIDAGDALPMRIAWVETGPQPILFPNPRYRVYAACLPNPDPRRKVARIAFSATEHAWSAPLILATTLETGAGTLPHQHR